MAYITTATISHPSMGEQHHLQIKINANAGGMFYCSLPDYLIEIHGCKKISSETLDDLKLKAFMLLKKYLSEEVSETPVILYNIESHVSFAENDEGEIVPNAGFHNSKWRIDESMFGGHHSSNTCKGGYSLTIGAMAQMKVTRKFNDKEIIEYKSYYKDGDHHGTKNPAELLNSWCSFSLDNAKEIPYTDEAALFFHNLLLGMAKISKMIQESTFDQSQLLKLIENGNNLLTFKD